MKNIPLIATIIACSFNTFTAEAAEQQRVYRSKSKKVRVHQKIYPDQKSNANKSKEMPATDKTAQSYEINNFALKVGDIPDKKSIRPRFAYCVPDGKGTTKNSRNLNPSIYWSPPPQGTKSLVLLVVDKDVPASFEKANIADQTIEASEPRQDFYHWVLVDIPPSTSGIEEGANSKDITKGGKEFGTTNYGINGQNDYAKMSEGTHEGYDGPCPPWNDNRMHQYHFTLYALDIPSVQLPRPIKGAQVAVVIKDHIIAQSEIVGNFSTNPKLQRTLRDNIQKKSKP